MAQIIVDFNKFDRRMLWKEWWFNRPKNDEEDGKKKALFPRQKTSKGRSSIKNFLNGVRSETLGTEFNK